MRSALIRCKANSNAAKHRATAEKQKQKQKQQYRAAEQHTHAHARTGGAIHAAQRCPVRALRARPEFQGKATSLPVIGMASKDKEAFSRRSLQRTITPIHPSMHMVDADRITAPKRKNGPRYLSIFTQEANLCTCNGQLVIFVTTRTGGCATF